MEEQCERNCRFSAEEREELLKSDPSPIGRRFNQLFIDYADKFNELLAIPVGMNTPIEEWIAEVQRCIDNGTPYVYPKSGVPDGCLI